MKITINVKSNSDGSLSARFETSYLNGTEKLKDVTTDEIANQVKSYIEQAKDDNRL